jgi:hypothetical protein
LTRYRRYRHFAIAAHAEKHKVHGREVGRSGHCLSEGSYGRRNRQAIAAREMQVAARLLAVERVHLTTIEHYEMFSPP